MLHLLRKFFFLNRPNYGKIVLDISEPHFLMFIKLYHHPISNCTVFYNSPVFLYFFPMLGITNILLEPSKVSGKGRLIPSNYCP